MNPQYDNALLGILQHEGKIEKFLDVIFGFLMRRTDFYHIMTDEQKKLGFPPGVNFRMVAHAFEKHRNIFEQFEHKRAETFSAVPAKNNTIASSGKVIQSDSKPIDSNAGDKTTSLVTATNPAKDTIPQKLPGSQSNIEGNNDDNLPPVYQADPDCYNGAVRDQYSWSQTIKDVDIRVHVPTSVKTAKNLKVTIGRKQITIKVISDGEEPFFNKTLCWDIHTDAAMWTFHPKEFQIHFCLEKVQERWWEAAFEGEDKINTRMIDCSRPMHELGDEEQAKIQQLMYDEQCKRQGLPTSEQQKIQKVLSKAWNQEGSPFRGTPFDPSKINISGSIDSSL